MSIAIDRTKFIGGSDVAAILGVSPWKSIVDLWMEKTRPSIDDANNIVAKRRGKRLEPYIIDMIREDYGLTITATNQRYIDQDYEFLTCEIDAECAEEDGVVNLEIKTVHPAKSKEWGDHDTDDLPLYYIAQTQHGLGITGRKLCRVFALIGDELKSYTVERDEELISMMREKSINFWRNYVIPKIQPPIDYEHKDVLDTLKRLYPGTDGTVIEANLSHCHWRAVYQTALEMKDKYDKIIEGAKAHLLAEMGSACAIKFDDGKSFTRKKITRKGFVVEPASYIDFRLSNFKEDV